jgi:hypothetical protein
MIARPQQFHRIEPVSGVPFRLEALLSPRAEAFLAFLFGALAFLPYPAIPVGSNSALQMGNLVSLVLVLPCLALPWKGQSFYLAPLLVVPSALSLFKVALTDGAELPLAFKSLVMSGFCGVALMATQRVAPRQCLNLLAGIAAATILHVVVGLWQLYGFAHGQLPLLGLYINPSFYSVQDGADTFVRYIRRPFGLFPEPSAMASSLAPWAVFWLAEACGLVRLRRPPTHRLRALFVVAAIGAVALIILSRSGHAMVTLAALAVLGGAVFLRSRATLRNYLALVAVSCILVPLCLWLAATALGDRIGGGQTLGDASWQMRADSLWVGLRLWAGGDVWTWAFGMGPGLTSPAIWREARLAAVWSVLLPYIYQTGVLGAAVVCWSAYYLGRVWRITRFNVSYALMLVVWLVGITITTSYGQLLPIWLALGWLTIWPAVCVPSEDLVLTPPGPWKPGELRDAVQRSLASRERRLALLDRPVSAPVTSNSRGSGILPLNSTETGNGSAGGEGS